MKDDRQLTIIDYIQARHCAAPPETAVERREHVLALVPATPPPGESYEDRVADEHVADQAPMGAA